MKLTHACNSAPSRQGFGLVELLTTMTIIGLLCAVALPLFGSQQEVFSAVQTKRNAQELVAECAVAQAAGVDFVVRGALDATVKALLKGATATGGAFKGRKFVVKNIDLAQLGDIKQHLRLDRGQLLMR